MAGELADVVALDAIAGRGFLSRLTPELAAELVNLSRSAFYPAGTILSPSVDGTGPALLVSGAMRYFLAGPDGRQITLRYLSPGDLAGTVIKEQSPLSTRLEVLRPAVLLHLDAGRLRGLVAREPSLAEAMLNETVVRLRAAYGALAARAFSDVRARVARDLVERARMSGPLEPGMHVEVTQQSLADATGSVREVVARAMRRLRDDGLVAGNSEGITIVDPVALSKAAAL